MPIKEIVANQEQGRPSRFVGFFCPFFLLVITLYSNDKYDTGAQKEKSIEEMSNRKIVEFDKTMTVFITKTSANSEVQLGRPSKTPSRDRRSKKSEERNHKRELPSLLARFCLGLFLPIICIVERYFSAANPCQLAQVSVLRLMKL